MAVWCVQAFAGLRITENNQQRFSFEWTTDKCTITPSGTVTDIDFAGSNAELGESGEPLIPAFSLFLGVPPGGIQAISFVPGTVHTVSVKSPLRKSGMAAGRKRYPGLSFSDPWISEPRQVRLAGLQCDQLIIRPFSCDATGGKLTVIDKAECTVRFAPGAWQKRGGAALSGRFRAIRGLVLNSEVALGWAGTKVLAKRAAATAFPLPATTARIKFAVGDGSSGYNEGTIEENGIIRLNGSDIIRLLGPSLPIGSIALYASYKGELPVEVPAAGAIPDGVSESPLLCFDAASNGLVDSADYFLAYVTGASDWVFDTLSRRFQHNLDRYDDYRHYWIAVKQGGQAARMGRFVQPAGPVRDTLTSFTNHFLLKKSVVPSLADGTDGGIDWAWMVLTRYLNSFVVDSVTLPSCDASLPCSIQVVQGFSSGTPPISVDFGPVQICNSCAYSGWYPLSYGGNRQLKVTITPYQNDTLEIKHVEFKYERHLDMTNAPSMTVFSPESSGLVRYRLGGIPATTVYIVRVGNYDKSIALVDTVRGGAGASYEWTDSAGIGLRYFLCAAQALKPPPALERAAPRFNENDTVKDLRTPSVPVKYLIVTHPLFMEQAARLAQHKKNIGSFASAKIVSVNDIYDQFSGGNIDPAAVRNCLQYLRSEASGWGTKLRQGGAELWLPELDYVLFLGHGHYDYKSHLVKAPNFLPVAEFREKCIEDFFVDIDPGERADNPGSTPDIFFGRIPCTTVQQASQAVDKLIQMEDPTMADFGGWRNRVLLIADDDMMQGGGPDKLGSEHTQSSELLAGIVEGLQPSTDLRKVYLFEYPRTALGEKPDASRALINQINNGVAYVNYFGHGTSNVWADEHILRPENIPSLQNAMQYPVISSFSCDVGRFDMPGEKRSLAEYLFFAVKSGAIATISSTRLAFSSDNRKLGVNFYNALFDTTDSAALTIGEAFCRAKLRGLDDNQKVYSFLGDPSLAITRSVRTIDFSLKDDRGAALDTIQALQHITVSGTIRKKGETVPDASFGTAQRPAFIQIGLHNPSYLTGRKDTGPISDVRYTMPGSLLFIGQTGVNAGVFSQGFMVPKNLAFGVPGAKCLAYAWQTREVSRGCKNNLVFLGYAVSTISDSTGPAIAIGASYTGAGAGSDASKTSRSVFADTIMSPLPFNVLVDIFDSSGIDNVSCGPDEGISIEVPGVITRTLINNKFQFSNGDYRRGNVTYPLPAGSMLSGTYTMIVTAQDMLGNVSRKSVVLEVNSEHELALDHVFTYPNPMRMGEECRFYFDLSRNLGQAVHVQIRLFTLSGRLLRVFTDPVRGEVFNGRDAYNNQLSPGVYLYQVTAYSMQNTQAGTPSRSVDKVVKSKIGKLAINPPRR